MFGWFRKRTTRLQPEARWIVEAASDQLRVTDPAGTVQTLAKAELRGVAIETNDTGPWGADVWWLLFGADERVAARYPQGATGEEAMLSYLIALPAFDMQQMAMAVGSTDNAYFLVWQTPPRG